MQTSTDTPRSAADLLDPLAGWEVAARWNRATFDWMAKGWQQWIALVTTLPPHVIATRALPSVTPALPFVTPAKAGAQEARAARSSDALDSRLRGNDGRAKPKTKSKKTNTARRRS